MVIEQLHDPEAIRERFERDGRMLPDGVAYHASWIDSRANRCFQLMEARDAEDLERWTSRWRDLASFEIVPVVTSAEFWAARKANG